MIKTCCLFLFAILLVTACGRADAPAYAPTFSEPGSALPHEYVVGVLPVHNPRQLLHSYGPIVDTLDRDFPGARFRLEASRNYEEFERKLLTGQFDLALVNPYQAIRAVGHGYRIFAKMGDDEDFRGIIVIRRDGGIRKVADLRGKTLAFPSANAVAGTMLPQHLLAGQGLRIDAEVTIRYVGSQDSVAVNVYQGDAAAGGMWLGAWLHFQAEHPDMAQQMDAFRTTAPLQNNAWVARKELPEDIVSRVAATLFRLQETPAGRAMLARIPISRFEAANDASYAPTRRFLEDYSRKIHPLDF